MRNTFELGKLHLTIVIMEVPGRLPERGRQLQLWSLFELREESWGGKLKWESSQKINLSISGGALCILVSDQTTCSDDHCQPARRKVPRGDGQPGPPSLWRGLWQLQEAPQTNPCPLGEESDYKMIGLTYLYVSGWPDWLWQSRESASLCSQMEPDRLSPDSSWSRVSCQS